MSPGTFLFTILLFLLGSDGVARPARHAYLSCEGIMMFSDDGRDATGPVAYSDSRGGVIFEAEPGDYSCKAWNEDHTYTFEGVIKVEKDHQTINVDLTAR